MGAAPCTPAAKPQKPRVGCTAELSWHRSGISEASFSDVYELGGLLGIGAFGQVRLCWPASDPEKRQYAVKVVDTKCEVYRHAAAFISARQEASILRSLRHPNIVELIDVFEQEHWLFLVMERLCGGELFASLANPRLAVTESCVAQVGAQLLQALRHLHERRIVHRDIKAENIMLVSPPAISCEWHIKLIDFGLATRLDPPACIFGMCQTQEAPLEELLCGTAYYCAPEVWTNEYGPKVDVWAAAVVLYLALHGVYPFYDRDPSLLEAVICSPHKPPAFKPACATECPGYEVTPRARQLLSEMLQKDPEKRPTASEALANRWLSELRRSRSMMVAPGPQLVEGLSARCASTRTSGGGGSASFSSFGELLTEGDQVIPVPVRAKAGRAVAQPGAPAGKDEIHSAAQMALRASVSVQASRPRPGSLVASLAAGAMPPGRARKVA